MNGPIEVDIQTLKRLAKKTVIITGGCSGIGLEAAKLFHSKGANVVLADRNQPRAEDAEILNSHRVRYVKCDITDWSSLLVRI